MERFRDVVATLLLIAWCGVGAFLMVVSGFMLLLFGDLEGGIADLGRGLGGLGLQAALLLSVPAGVALALRPRHRVASGWVAAALGVGIFGYTAPDATSYGFLLAASLGGLLLVLTAVPLPGSDTVPSGPRPRQTDDQGDLR